MALAHAILTALSHEPLSGYDLSKAFNTSTGFFWRASSQQIYAELRRLEQKGLLESRRHVQDRYPDRIVYAVTPAGDDVLQAWLNRASAPASIKEELLVKLYALDKADIPEISRQLQGRRDHHAERLALFLSIEARLRRTADEARVDLGRLLAVRAGVKFETALRDWCDETLKTLRAATGAND